MRVDPSVAVGVDRRDPMDATPTRPDRRATLLAWIVVGVASVAAAALLLHVGRGLTWFYDEWSWILTRRTGSLDDFLANHNGHLNLVPVAVYKVMWAMFGLEHYTAFRVLAVVLHVGTCVLLFVYVRRRAQLWFAVAATVVILFLGYAYQDLLWPFQIQYLGAVAAGIGALLLLDRRDAVGDVGASVALAVAVACSGVGLPFVGAVTLELLLRRTSWRRLWVPLVPLALWGLWYLQYGTSQVKGSNFHLVPENAALMGSAASGALFGISMDSGRVLLGLLGIVVAVVLAVERRISPRFAAVLALALGYWILTALSRAQYHDPAASRYLYPGAVFVVLVLAELVPRVPRGSGRVGTVLGGLVLVVLVAVSVRGNVDQLRQGGAGLRDASTYVKAELRAVELAGARVDPGFRPDPVRAPQIDAGRYLAAIHDLGSPADSVADLRRQPAAVRNAADVVLLQALRVRLRGAGDGTGSACSVSKPAGASDAQVELQARGPVVISAEASPVRVAARAFGDAPVSLGTVAPGTTRTLGLVPIAAGPWRVQVDSSGPVRVCPAG